MNAATELLATLHEIAGNKPAVFTLRNVGAVGQVLEEQLAAIEAALTSRMGSGLEDGRSPPLRSGSRAQASPGAAKEASPLSEFRPTNAREK